MKKSYTLQQAWDILDEKYKCRNVHDVYALKQDWMKAIDDVKYYGIIANRLYRIEESMGIANILDKIDNLAGVVAMLRPGVFDYKFEFSDNFRKEVKTVEKETIDEIKILEEQIKNIRNTVSVDPEILNVKN